MQRSQRDTFYTKSPEQPGVCANSKPQVIGVSHVCDSGESRSFGGMKMSRIRGRKSILLCLPLTCLWLGVHKERPGLFPRPSEIFVQVPTKHFRQRMRVPAETAEKELPLCSCCIPCCIPCSPGLGTASLRWVKAAYPVITFYLARKTARFLLAGWVDHVDDSWNCRALGIFLSQ